MDLVSFNLEKTIKFPLSIFLHWIRCAAALSHEGSHYRNSGKHGGIHGNPTSCFSFLFIPLLSLFFCFVLNYRNNASKQLARCPLLFRTLKPRQGHKTVCQRSPDPKAFLLLQSLEVNIPRFFSIKVSLFLSSRLLISKFTLSSFLFPYLQL